jgi:hypothetical protein
LESATSARVVKSQQQTRISAGCLRVATKEVIKTKKVEHPIVNSQIEQVEQVQILSLSQHAFFSVDPGAETATKARIVESILLPKFPHDFAHNTSQERDDHHVHATSPTGLSLTTRHLLQLHG